jgi:hypothetical protein
LAVLIAIHLGRRTMPALVRAVDVSAPIACWLDDISSK